MKFLHRTKGGPNVDPWWKKGPRRQLNINWEFQNLEIINWDILSSDHSNVIFRCFLASFKQTDLKRILFYFIVNILIMDYNLYFMQLGGAIRQEGLVPLIQLLSSIWFHCIFYIQISPSLLRFIYNLSEDKFYFRWLKIGYCRDRDESSNPYLKWNTLQLS